jgi:hypothetical protein
MPKKKYLVTLTDDERQQLEDLLHSGTHATRKVTRARILLKAAEGWRTTPSRQRSRSGEPRSNASANASSQRGWGHWRSVHAPARRPSWMQRPKPV